MNPSEVLMNVAVRPAGQGHLPSIRSLLTSVDLTVAGVGEHVDHFLVVEDAGKIVACAGLETYGFHALLRSVAVHPHYRNRGLATLLVSRLVDQTRQDRLHAVHLLTTSAEAYFRRLGSRQFRGRMWIRA
jgi:N-acetylglutamate synthase-like GNAT family acetyltransferase